MIVMGIYVQKKKEMAIKQKISIIAHRGLSSLYPENTIISFKKALELDVDMIELDVHGVEMSIEELGAYRERYEGRMRKYTSGSKRWRKHQRRVARAYKEIVKRQTK